MPVSVKNVPPNWGTVAAHGLLAGIMPSPISLVHSIACSTVKAAPKNIVASSQLRVQALSPRFAAITPRTIVSELDSRHAVINVAFAILGLPNGVGHAGLAMRL